MSQKKASIKVPADLLPGIKTFHEIREKVKREISELNKEYAALQTRMKREQLRLDSLFQGAMIVAQQAMVDAKIVTQEQVFVIDTSYLDDHGEAYIVLEGTESDSEPPRTLH
jgi:hypothetical protein